MLCDAARSGQLRRMTAFIWWWHCAETQRKVVVEMLDWQSEFWETHIREPGAVAARGHVGLLSTFTHTVFDTFVKRKFAPNKNMSCARYPESWCSLSSHHPIRLPLTPYPCPLHVHDFPPTRYVKRTRHPSI